MVTPATGEAARKAVDSPSALRSAADKGAGAAAGRVRGALAVGLAAAVGAFAGAVGRDATAAGEAAFPVEFCATGTGTAVPMGVGSPVTSVLSPFAAGS